VPGKKDEQVEQIDFIVVDVRACCGYSNFRGAFGVSLFGHRVYLDQSLDAYQDGIVRYLQDRGLGGWPEIPSAGQNYMPPWRYDRYDTSWTLRKGWDRLEKSGDDMVWQWLDGVETEEQWAGLMFRVIEWEKEQTPEEGTYMPTEDVSWLY